jgi:hypothetical protein
LESACPQRARAFHEHRKVLFRALKTSKGSQSRRPR